MWPMGLLFFIIPEFTMKFHICVYFSLVLHFSLVSTCKHIEKTGLLHLHQLTLIVRFYTYVIISSFMPTMKQDIFSIQWCTTQQTPCLQSIQSKIAVKACPTSKEDWESAARKKNCAKLASLQNCTTPDNFKYHCVINSYRNETVEVCAPRKLIIGYCFHILLSMKPHIFCPVLI